MPLELRVGPVPSRQANDPEFLETADGQKLMQILADDAAVQEAESQIWLQHFLPEWHKIRKALERGRERLNRCASSVVDADLTELDQQAGKLAEIRKKIKALQVLEGIAQSDLQSIKDRLSEAEHIRRNIDLEIHHSGHPVLLRKLLASELEAAGL